MLDLAFAGVGGHRQHGLFLLGHAGPLNRLLRTLDHGPRTGLRSGAGF
jgi:hypothetical protein